MSEEDRPGLATARVHDPRVLRAIAHPLRNRILAEMSATGPVRAADVARDLGIPANQASFHLRQLAKYGIVEQAPGLGRDRRDRVWQLVAPDGLSADLTELRHSPGGPEAIAVWRRQAAAWTHTVVDAAYTDLPTEDTHKAITEQALRLTKTEAEQLTDEISQLLRRWTARTRSRDPQRRSYLLLQILQPYPEPPTNEDSAP